ncbi:MAG: DNA cytosine methyltransferase [Chloroflexota bacterium]|nr:DNA cytosine methyltransferase [Chloroflexota bacterium]
MIERHAQMRVAEFFAGIGLVRMAIEEQGFNVVWANDIEPAKLSLYERNFDAGDFVLDDIRNIHGADIPDIDLATASFPCTDLSLAGNRVGLRGEQSGLFWEFARVLREMRERRPYAIMLENVPSFATSHGGRDLRLALQRLNRLGYWCDLLVIDARHFVPQSRPRLFIVGSRDPLTSPGFWEPSSLRPPWIRRFVQRHPELRLHALPLSLDASYGGTLADIVQRLPASDDRWWNTERQWRFVQELSPLQLTRLNTLRAGRQLSWATAYRRTRDGKPAWEIRADAISGCLRTARGGSSKQALVEAGEGQVRVRWMTALEYAGLQGAASYNCEGVPDNRILFGFGDAVCVPAVSWLARQYLRPLLRGEHTAMRRAHDRELVRV